MGARFGASGSWTFGYYQVKIALDAMMPWEIILPLSNHEILHVTDLGWGEVKNGELLKLCEDYSFEVLLTKDGQMPHQQSLKGRKLVLVVFRPRTQDMDDLIAMAPEIELLLEHVSPGQVYALTQDRSH